MKRANEDSENSLNKKKKIKNKALSQKRDVGNIEDVKRLVHLLQVHQIELEHQNHELRNAQEELEVSRNKYVNLYDFAPIPYFTLDKSGKILEVNISASKMFGVDRSKLIGKNFISFVPLDEKDVFTLFIDSIFNAPLKHNCELKTVSKDKQVFHVRLEGIVINDALELAPKCLIAVIDLSAHIKVEESLEESTRKLKVLNATKDKFFSIIAHDLRSPFQSLLSSTELLASEIETLTQEEIKLFYKGVNDNLNNLFGLLENLLNWSLMQRGMLEYEPINLNICDAVNRVIDILMQSAAKKNIYLQNNIKADVFVYADDDMIRSVVQNLIMNAIKFTPVDGKIIISAIEKKGFIEISVQDNGIGIAAEKISKIFYFCSLFSTHGTAGEKGTGLGLPLCKEFIDRNNGKFWVESELGKGSKFTFALPKEVF